MIDVNEYVQKPIQQFLKRIVDIMFSLFALLLLSPIFLIVSLWIIVDDGLPIFFRQKRSGRNDTVFSLYKFRSMKNKQVPVPSETRPYDKWVGGVPNDFVFKTASEENPNITKVGHFIRKYSLDELPQFINVLKGEMSIIGPRPEILAISEHYNENQKQRLLVKPGITGWAQVNGRSDMDHGNKIKYDVYYVYHFSLLLDIKVFIRTITQVISGKGSV